MDRVVGAAARILLAAWCVLGVVQTARGLAGPAGWRVARPQAATGTVGMPMPGADAVTAASTLLSQDRASEYGPWLLVLPDDTPDFTLLYIRYQLAHVRYPQRVEVGTPGRLAPDGPYAGIITAPGISLGPPWRTVAEHLGFVLYRREES